MRIRIFVAMAAAFFAAAPAVWAAPASSCKPQALRDLGRLAPEGYAVYRAATDKAFFTRWITCDDVQLGLATAVHETVHMLTEDQDAFPLIGGGSVKRVHAVSRFFPPREIAKRFDRSSTYVETYLLPGAATSADDLLYLLDELNAYTHDLNAVIGLQSLHNPEFQVDHKNGLTSLMSFVMAYVDTAQRTKPKTWEGLQRPEVKKLVQTLWAQAETELAKSCGMDGLGSSDAKLVAFMGAESNNSAMGKLLDRPTATSCPSGKAAS